MFRASAKAIGVKQLAITLSVVLIAALSAAAVGAAALLALAGDLAAAGGTAQPARPYLYLLAGTADINGIPSYPVRLYTLSTGRLALVRQVSGSLFSVTDDLHGHLYVLSQSRGILSVIHENAPKKLDVVSAPPVNGPDQGFDFYYPTWGAIAGLGVPPGIVFADWTDHWVVTRIFGDAIPGRPRVEKGNWGLYRYFQYAGPGGGPSHQNALGPDGTINHGRILMAYTLGGPGQGDLGPTPPFLSPRAGVAAGYPGRPRGAAVVADTASFFAFTASLPGAASRSSQTIYLLNRATKRWSAIEFPLCSLSPRLFGVWLACNVSRIISVRHSPPRQANGDPVNRITPQGKLLLQNLVDDREITIQTGQQDSEVIDVRDDGSVLYRVNDSIFSTQIEGDKLSAPTLVVKDDDMPEVHWVFWSTAGSHL